MFKSVFVSIVALVLVGCDQGTSIADMRANLVADTFTQVEQVAPFNASHECKVQATNVLVGNKFDQDLSSTDLDCVYDIVKQITVNN